MPAMIRTFALISALALMWGVTVGLVLYGGAWVLFLGAELYEILIHWLLGQGILDVSIERYIPRLTPSLPDANWAATWSLYVMSVMTLLPFVMNALQPTSWMVASITGVSRKDLRRVESGHDLHAFFREVVQQARPGKPVSLFLIPGEGPVALAMGAPFRGMVVLSEGMVRGLSAPELRWVIAHELAHIRHRDMLVGTVWISSIRGLRLFHRLKVMLVTAALRVLVEIRLPGLALVLNWMLSVLLWTLSCGRSIAVRWFLLFDRLASRLMEFRADRCAAQQQGIKPGVSVLLRLEGDSEPLFNGLFATHPKISQRIEALQALAQPKPA